MANVTTFGGARAATAAPQVRKISVADLGQALREGWNDFRDTPTHLILLCIIYPVAGLVLGRMASGADALPLIWPLVAGFVLIGPVAAVGLYEISRRRETNVAVSVRDAFGVLRTRNFGGILLLALALAVLFVVWLLVAQAVFNATMPGLQPDTPMAFAGAVLGTAGGWKLIVLGTAAGFVFALAVLVFGVISFPLLVDRDLGSSPPEQALTALSVSARAFAANPVPILVWGLIVAALMAAGFATLLVGLAVVLPVLGHATWHLYRKIVVA